MVTAGHGSSLTIGMIGRPTHIVQQRICRRIPIQRDDQLPGAEPSRAAEAAHALIVSLHSVVLGFVYIRKDGVSYYEDGSIGRLSVPSRLRSIVLKALQVQTTALQARGSLARLQGPPFTKLIREGFGLTSCY